MVKKSCAGCSIKKELESAVLMLARKLSEYEELKRLVLDIPSGLVEEWRINEKGKWVKR